MLLQILDDGRLTDGQGRIVNFKNTIIIMTSNIGSAYYQEEKDPKVIENKVTGELRKYFRPEFLNRVDEIIVFNKLIQKDIVRIVDLQLADLVRKLEERRIRLKIDPAAKEKLAQEGYDEEFGARPLKRLLQREVQDVLALDLLKGQYKEGDTVTLEVDKKTGAFLFS
jgi:ATP-dependent Clp protease ATP-binding subunit ClpB